MKKMIGIFFLLNVENFFASQNVHACDNQLQKAQYLCPQVTVSDTKILETYVGKAILGEEWKVFIENYKKSKVARSKKSNLLEVQGNAQGCHVEAVGNVLPKHEECASHELVMYHDVRAWQEALSDDDIEVTITFAFSRNQHQK